MTLTEERIMDVLNHTVGDEDAQRIIFYLKGKNNISEFIIAEELDLEIHRTRNLLYKLLDKNIVTFKRKKDKIKGWYICYWDFNEAAVPHLEEKYRVSEIQKIEERLNREQNGVFYMCRYAHTRMTFDDSFEENFKCPECGELMNQLDNERTIQFLTGKLEKLNIEQDAYEATLAQKREDDKKRLIAMRKQQEEDARRAIEEKKLAEERRAAAKIAAAEKKKAVAKKKAEAVKKRLAKKEEAAKKKAAKKVAKKVAKKKSSTKKAVKKSVSTKKKVATKKKAAKKKTVAKKKAVAKKSPAKKKAVAKKKVAKKKSATKKVAKKSTSKKKSSKKKTARTKKAVKRGTAK
jgi:transcription factor E